MNKPCPFCGTQCANAKLGEHGAFMECSGCNARGPIVNVSSDPNFEMFQACKSWNTRSCEKESHPTLKELPAEPGFYWWRPHPKGGWRALKVYELSPRHLCVNDIDMNNFLGRSIENWASYFPVGEWLWIAKPL